MKAREISVKQPGPVARWLALFGVLSGLLGFVLLQWGRANPAWVEEHYAGDLFPRLRGVLLELARASSFSLAERAIGFFGLWVLFLLLRAALRCYRGTHSLGGLLHRGLLRCLGLAGWGYAAFLLCWGFNHARLPYAELAQLELRDSSDEAKDLGDLLESLVEECNRLRPLFDSDELNLRGSGGRADARLLQGYAALVESVPELEGPEPVFRKAWSAPWLTRLGITGIYSPFTAEAHLKAAVPLYSQPFAACHEVAHARGFAREDEANFIAWQVCQASGDDAFAYSGAYVALGHVSRALRALDPKRDAEILKTLTRFVIQDQKLEHEFWVSRHSVVTEVSHSTNDLYLKAQGQQAGIQSYGRMVKLLLAEWHRAQDPAGSEEG